MADDDELADEIEELTRTVDELRRELESESSRRRPPLRPPTPRELLAFTDEVALPAVLSILEASVRALEAFQRGLELVRTEREVRDRASETAAVTGDRADEFRRTTLSRLDTVLEELQRAASEGALPADEGARDLLSEARRLRDEIDSRLADAAAGEEFDRTGTASDGFETTGTVRIDVEEGSPADATDDPDDPKVDVDAELETLKDQYGPEDEADETDGSDASGDHEDTAANGERDDSTGDSADDENGSDDPEN